MPLGQKGLFFHSSVWTLGWNSQQLLFFVTTNYSKYSLKLLFYVNIHHLFSAKLGEKSSSLYCLCPMSQVQMKILCDTSNSVIMCWINKQTNSQTKLFSQFIYLFLVAHVERKQALVSECSCFWNLHFAALLSLTNFPETWKGSYHPNSPSRFPKLTPIPERSVGYRLQTFYKQQ